MKTFKTVAFIAILTSILYSCQNDELFEPEPAQEVPAEVLLKIQQLGVNTTGVIPYTQELPDGTKEFGWLSHDIFLSHDDILNMPNLPSSEDEVTQKLYRTNNLVRVPNNGRRVITVRGRNLNRNLRRGLRRAVANYNNLNLKFRLELSFGNNNGGKNIVVFSNSSNNQGGVAGFPRNGNPFNRVEIDGGSSSLPLGAIEHLMTHELGHCFGLRHSDFGTRSSCPPFLQGNEGAGSIGAVFIPGTDGSVDSQSSVMRACFRINETGNFFRQDRVGLRRLYQ
ncbi:M57 family metalloprotease [Aquimarina sp. 2201CG14-23]|uniref:M57 family metalloprotease n=1 Tax=Aquimarina mycalae TaxID=3040073 RepID=UPI002478210F|nr:M57 family metalloprotease [Aquimarina sp. 2201CG14-23]MDH7444923.1 M57 family metalloprotease [Aquimarina sp. 2201CG14-23]